MTSTIINGSYDESRWDDAVDAFRKMPMLFPRRGLSFANLCSTHMSLPPLCFSLSFTNPSCDILYPTRPSQIAQYNSEHLQPLQTTQSCPLLLPVTSPLAPPLSLPLHLHSLELLAKSLPSKQQSIDNANVLASMSADQNTYRNVFETPGVRNVADRYAAQGGTTTHLPGVATPLGMSAMPTHGYTAECLLICGFSTRQFGQRRFQPGEDEGIRHQDVLGREVRAEDPPWQQVLGGSHRRCEGQIRSMRFEMESEQRDVFY